MKEYEVYLCNPSDTVTVLAVSFEEAYKIAYEQFGSERVVQVIRLTPYTEFDGFHQ